MNLNKVMLIGRLTRDPEMRYTPNGSGVTNFSLATNRWSGGEEKKQLVDYHNVVVWNKLAEVAAQYLVKGSLVYVEGRMQTRSWEGQDGQKRKTTEVVAQNIQFLDRKRQEQENEEPVAPSGESEFNADEIPF